MKKLIPMLMLVLFVGCSPEVVTFGSGVLIDKPIVQSEQVFDLGVVMTVGNHSYLPINVKVRYGSIESEMIPTILNILDQFGKKHPDLEVTSWSLFEDQSDESILYGLWINHKPK